MTTAGCLKVSAKLAGVFWKCLAIVILIAAIVVQLARELTPIVNQHVEEVNAQLSKTLGLDVKIGEIHSRWEGFRPNLRLKQVKIYGKHARPQQSSVTSQASSLGFQLSRPPTLNFQSLDVELDVLSSLKEWRWVVSSLQLQHAKIRLVQQASGRWILQGIMPNGSNSGRFLKDPMDIFKLAEQVNIQSVSLYLQMFDGEKQQLDLKQVRLEKHQDFHRFKADITLNSHKLAYLVLESNGDPRGDKQGERHIQGYVEILQSALFGFPWHSLPESLQKYLPIAALEQEFGRFSPSANSSAVSSLSTQHMPSANTGSPLSPFLSRVWFSSQHQDEWDFQGDWLFRKAFKPVSALPSTLPKPSNLYLNQAAEQETSPLDQGVSDHLPLNFSGQFAVNWQRSESLSSQWRFDWRDIQLTWEDVSEPLPSGSWMKQQDEMRIELPSIGLASVSQNIQKLLSQSPFDKLRSALSNLSASGQLEHVMLRKSLNDASAHWEFQALAEKVAVKSWKSVPGIVGLSGWAQGQLGQDGLSGQFHFSKPQKPTHQSDEPFGLKIPKVFATPLYAKPYRGTIFYQWQPDHHRVWIAGDDIQARLPRRGKMSGRFQVLAPTQSGAFDGQLELALGFRNLSVRDHVLYTPKTLPVSAKNWLAASLGDGRIPDGSLLFRGSLSKGAHAKSKQLQLALEMSQLDLAYHEDWPELTDIVGKLMIDNQRIAADIAQATLWDTDIQSASVQLMPSDDTSKTSPESNGKRADGMQLELHAKAAAPAGNLIRMVRGTPLQAQLGSALGSWQSEGRADIDLTLAMPLSSQPDVTTKLTMNLDLDDLYLSQADLTLDKISGIIAFDSAKGVTSKGLVGQLWGEKLTFSFEPTYNTQGKPSDHLLYLSGAARPKSLRHWIKRPELDFVSGLLPFEGLMRFPLDQKPISLAFKSNLRGVSVNAPPPLGKSTDQLGQLAMDMSIQPQGLMDLTMTYDPVRELGSKVSRSALNLRMKTRDEQLQGLALGLGQPARLQPNLIHIGGQIAEPMFLPTWADWAKTYFQALQDSDHSEIVEPQSLDARSADALSANHKELSASREKVLPMQFALLFDDVRIQDHVFSDWSVAGELLGEAWRLGIRQNNLSASVYHAGEGVPYDIQVDKLMWPAAPPHGLVPEKSGVALTTDGEKVSLNALKSQVLAQDILRDFKVEQLPPMKVRIANAQWGEKSLGDWQFFAYPLNSALIVDEIQGEMAGFRLLPSKAQSKVGASGARIRWFKNAQQEWTSHIEGRLKGKNLSDVFREMGQEAPLETARASVDFNLIWPGSPVAWDYRLMQGEVGVALADGRFNQSAGAAGDAFLRLISIFNFDSWARRLRLGLTDLYQDGMAFDQVNGRLLFGLGQIHIAKPMVAKTPSGELKLSGLIDLRAEKLDTKLVAVIPAGGNLAVLAGLAVGLPAAAGVYVVSKLFKRQVDKLSSANYRVNGEWLSPKVRFIGLFDNETSARTDRYLGAEKNVGALH